MTSALAHVRKAADSRLIVSPRTQRVLLVVGFALLTAVGAKISVPLPGTPVPVTLQTFFVTLAGALIGARLAAASQLTYLAAGVAGVPVFAFGAGIGHLFGPTGGYLLAFPLGAAVVGRLCGDNRASAVRIAGACTAGTLLILALGVAQLSVLTGDFGRAVRLGALPFLLGDVIKIALATIVAWRVRSRFRRST
jgi:biotin transport system substrate-specific component